MSRGMTPAILAMVNQRERDKMRCMLAMRRPQAQTPRHPSDEVLFRKQRA
ncbi:MAG: hypothetical protein P4L83_03465 [Nevskia sp.]|nr:hypothetical protein [Nevskia sp.]